MTKSGSVDISGDCDWPTGGSELEGRGPSYTHTA